MEITFSEAVKVAYDKARMDSGNLSCLPGWDQLPTDMRCAFVTVFAEGIRNGLDKIKKVVA